MLKNLFKTTSALLEASKPRLSILIYHRILDDSDPMRPDATTVETFSWHMKMLRDHFNPLSLSEAVQRLQAGTLPPRAVCVSFDDGYADNLELALPVLQAHAIPATVFVATAYLDGGRMWNDTLLETVRSYDSASLSLPEWGLKELPLDSGESRFEAARAVIRAVKHLDFDERESFTQTFSKRATSLPSDLMLTTTQLQALANHPLISIGAHTHRHPILATLNDAQSREEILTSKDILEDKLGRSVSGFAYPNGRPEQDFNAWHPDLVAELGFDFAVTTKVGVGVQGSDTFQLPRFTPWDKSAQRFLLRMLRARQRIVLP